jgi:hypothetical protein
VTYTNPKGTITNNNLELAASSDVQYLRGDHPQLIVQYGDGVVEAKGSYFQHQSNSLFALWR